MAITKVTTGTIADDSIQSLKNRNLIINGAMQVAQRATSVTGITSNGYQTLDRFRFTASGATFNTSQQTLPLGQTDIPSQFKYFMRFEVTTGNDNAGITQRIEDVEIISDQNVTVSFYAKGTNPGGGSVEVKLNQVFGSGGSSSVAVTDTITLTSSWQRFEKTFTLSSLSGKTIATGNYLAVNIGQGADTSTNAWTMDITGIQLEAGDVATPFEHESFGETLAKCFRYYYRLNANANYSRWADGCWDNANQASVIFPILVPMRSEPSIDSTGSASDYAVVNAGTVHTCTSIPSFSRSTITSDGSCALVTLVALSNGNGTAGNAAQLMSVGGGAWTGDFLGLDAEL